jgi:hypothetical protein
MGVGYIFLAARVVRQIAFFWDFSGFMTLMFMHHYLKCGMPF